MSLSSAAGARRGVGGDGKVTLPADLGWKPLFDGKTLEGWEPRGDCLWSVLPDGTLLGQRSPGTGPADLKQFASWMGRQAWLYTKAEYGEFDLHVEYWIPAGGNSGVSIRDRSRAHGAIGEEDSARPDLAAFPKTTPAHIGYEIQIIDDDAEKYPTGSVYTFVPREDRRASPRRVEQHGYRIAQRQRIRVRLNGRSSRRVRANAARSKTGPIGLQLHDRFSCDVPQSPDSGIGPLRIRCGTHPPGRAFSRT